MRPTFSICITNYNTAPVLERRLDSILRFFHEDEYEVIVVDSKSTDGSLGKLLDYAERTKNMKVISRKCLRGMGWQMAFDHSIGSIIVIVALDTIYNEKWYQAVKMFEEKGFPFALHMWYSEIYPRNLLYEVGGWRNIQYSEDMEIRARLARIGKLRRYPLICGEDLKRNPGVTYLEKTLRRYRKIHDTMLLATQIPLRLWIGGTLLKLRQATASRANVIPRISYYLPILLFAKLVSSLRRRRGNYGNIRDLMDREAIYIDLRLGVTKQDHEREHRYDTTERCWRAYRAGDVGFIPLLYD